jgi:uncharacterized membrane protein
MRGSKTSHVAFALGTLGLGALTLVCDDLALGWEPVPSWVPWQHGLAYLAGALLVGAGVGLLIHRVAVAAALALAGYQLVWVLFRGARAFSDARVMVQWEGFCEALALVLGAWAVVAWVVQSGDKNRLGALVGHRSRKLTRILFGLACVGFGLSHFAYADFTAKMVPAWFPQRPSLAYLTGACHLAAGLGLISGVRARLAARLEALMLSLFVILVHVPSLFAATAPEWAPDLPTQWTELLLAWRIGASAAAIATWLPSRADK